MNKNYKNRLKKYSSIAGSFIVAGSKMAHAQVVYTDLSPDITVAGNDVTYDVYLLNFDGDANSDLNIGQGTEYTTYAEVFVATNGYSTTTGIVGTGYEATALNLGATIGSASSFTTAYHPDLAKEYNGSIINGQFAGAGDKYIGVRFVISGQTHYGWVLVNVSSLADEIVVKEYAYDATPNATIAAGHKGAISAADELENITINLYPNPAQNTLSVDGSEVDAYQIFNSLGTEIKSGVPDLNKIDVSNLQSGTYTIKLNTEKGPVIKHFTKA